MASRFRTRYDRNVVGFSSSLPSATLLDDFQDTLITNILQSHGVANMNTNTPIFGDFTNCPTDYADAHARLEQASQLFMELPSNVREKFNNNAVSLLNWLSDPNNRKDAEALGLVKTVSPAPTQEPPTESGSTLNT